MGQAAKNKPVVQSENAYFLKGHASWLYCGHCKQTVAYLCYVTYRYFRFSFTCTCGGEGWVENRYGDIDAQSLHGMEPPRSATNQRFVCAQDESPLFSPVPKHLQAYSAAVVCKQCTACYAISAQL